MMFNRLTIIVLTSDGTLSTCNLVLNNYTVLQCTDNMLSKLGRIVQNTTTLSIKPLFAVVQILVIETYSEHALEIANGEIRNGC